MRAAESLSTQLRVKLFDDSMIFNNVLEHQKSLNARIALLCNLMSQVYLAFREVGCLPGEMPQILTVESFSLPLFLALHLRGEPFSLENQHDCYWKPGRWEGGIEEDKKWKSELGQYILRELIG